MVYPLDFQTQVLVAGFFCNLFLLWEFWISACWTWDQFLHHFISLLHLPIMFSCKLFPMGFKPQYLECIHSKECKLHSSSRQIFIESMLSSKMLFLSLFSYSTLDQRGSYRNFTFVDWARQDEEINQSHNSIHFTSVSLVQSTNVKFQWSACWLQFPSSINFLQWARRRKIGLPHSLRRDFLRFT